MDAFSPRPNAHLDYWFWKFHVGDLAFLVDLIVRRQTGLAEVRVSQWLRGVGRVVHDETQRLVDEPRRGPHRPDDPPAGPLHRVHGRHRLGSVVA